MANSHSAVAVLLFTRSAGEEAVHKQFVGQNDRARNAAVAAQLIDHATATARQVGVDFVCVDSSQQTGRTFGERLAGALQQGFAQGYEHLLVMGNDCPQLDELLLRQALTVLRRNDTVLGPATDGGVYLLGVSHNLFDYQAWASLPWQTPQLGAALLHQLQQQGAEVSLLPALADIDNEQDLVQALRQPLQGPLQRRLRRLRAARRAMVRPTCRPAGPRLCVAARPHRGPPNN